MEKEKKTELSIKHFAKSSVKEIFNLDRSILLSVKTLILRPGYLTIDYFKNRENIYTNPLKLYLIINFIFFLITPSLNSRNFKVFSIDFDALSQDESFNKTILDSEIEKSGLRESIYKERFNASLKYNQPAFMFLTVPVIALVLLIINFRRKNYFVEHLIYSLHFISAFLIFMITIMVLYRIFDFLTFPTFSTGLFLIVSIASGISIYLYRSLRIFYNSGIISSLFKTIFLLAGFYLSMGLYIQFLVFYTVFTIRYGY
jgi:hypothetical protein